MDRIDEVKALEQLDRQLTERKKTLEKYDQYLNLEQPLKYMAPALQEEFGDRLTQLAPIFLKNKYMLGDDFSMLDVAIAPLLWRLDYYGIDMSKNALPLLKYAERIFSRPAYIEALTPSEKVMRK